MIKQQGSLRIGYTTGTCAAAAAKGAVLHFLGRPHTQLEVRLPGGETACIVPHRTRRTGDAAFCEIIKDAGDDPDITHGALIKATYKPVASGGIIINGGEGVGTVTRPGLAVPPGKPAINPVPQQMILKAVAEVLPSQGAEISISVAGGKELAKKTLNPRLGIVGGISILGTTGLVIPYSHEAYKESIRCAFDVIQAMGLDLAVLCTGRASEKAVQQMYPDLPDAAFILMADYFSYAVAEAAAHGIRKIMIAAFLGKLLKIAAGAECTHYRSASVDMAFLAELAGTAGMRDVYVKQIHHANSARHALDFIEEPYAHSVFNKIAQLVITRIKDMTDKAVRAEVVLLGYDGGVLHYEKNA